VPFNNAKTTLIMYKKNKYCNRYHKTCLSELHKSITFGQNNTTLCPKNDTGLACCNFYILERILIIFGINVNEKAWNHEIFPSLPPNYSASALPGKMLKQ